MKAKTWKRCLTLLPAAGLLFGLAACNPKTPTTSPRPGPQKPDVNPDNDRIPGPDVNPGPERYKKFAPRPLPPPRDPPGPNPDPSPIPMPR